MSIVFRDSRGVPALASPPSYTIQKVAHEGDATLGGGSITQLYGDASIADDGRVAFYANDSGVAQTLFLWDGGGLSVGVVEGDVAPDTGGALVLGTCARTPGCARSIRLRGDLRRAGFAFRRIPPRWGIRIGVAASRRDRSRGWSRDRSRLDPRRQRSRDGRVRGIRGPRRRCDCGALRRCARRGFRGVSRWRQHTDRGCVFGRAELPQDRAGCGWLARLRSEG